MKVGIKEARKLHEDTPANWYFWLHFYPRGWVWNHTHIQTYRKNYLTKICRQAGFKIEADKKFNLGMLHLVKVRK